MSSEDAMEFTLLKNSLTALRAAEDYRVELAGVTQLDLTIIPDRNGGDARASRAEWRLA